MSNKDRVYVWRWALEKAFELQNEKYKYKCICGKVCSGLEDNHKKTCKQFNKSVQSKANKLYELVNEEEDNL